MSEPPRVATLLGIFAKHWTPGKVKTRLAPTIGESHAATLHALFVATLAQRLAALADDRVIVHTPDDCGSAFKAVAGNRWRLAPQGDGSLGDRMQRFFATCLKQAQRVVLIGSDSPDVPVDYIQHAFDSLAKSEVVLGPATDGGYYLIGMKRVYPVFERIDWSTPAVWRQSVEKLRQANVVWEELPGWHDVDDDLGLAALMRNLDSPSVTDPALHTLRTQVITLMRTAPTRNGSK
jgi:rSAM/selenodomain-associated transferase 1